MWPWLSAKILQNLATLKKNVMFTFNGKKFTFQAEFAQKGGFGYLKYIIADIATIIPSATFTFCVRPLLLVVLSLVLATDGWRRIAGSLIEATR